MYEENPNITNITIITNNTKSKRNPNVKYYKNKSHF